MPYPSKADNNVPFLAGRSRYNIVNTTPTWCYHKMSGVALTGAAPRTAALTEAETDPVVTSGKAVFSNLTQGGLFTQQSKAKRPLVVEAIDNQAGATLTIMSSDNTTFRAAPTTVPFKMAAGEIFKAVGGTSGGSIGILYRIEGQEIF